MTEVEPIKPEAKRHVHHPNILRPATDGHNLADNPDPELDRNQPSFTEERIKLNLDAPAFHSKNEKKLYHQSNQANNQAFIPNNINQNTAYYNPNNAYMAPPPGYNPYAMPPMSNPPYVPNFSRPRFNNNQRNMPNMPNMYAPPNFQPNYSNRQNQMNQGNNNYRKYNKAYNNTNNQNNQSNQKQLEDSTKFQTKISQSSLNAEATPFIPKSKQEEKNKIEKSEQKSESNLFGLNIGAAPYKPRNLQLKQKDELAHSNKEENKEEKESNLSKLLNNNLPSKSNKEKNKNSNHTKDNEKNISSNLKKKNSKKNELFDKKFDNLRKKEEQFKKEEEDRKKKEKEEKKRKEEEEKKRKEEEKRIKEEQEKERKRLEELRLKEEEERKKRESEKVIEKKYFITFKNKKLEKIEKFTFEYILQFKKWKISTEDELLTKDVKKHFLGFKEEVREGGKKKKEDNNNRKKDTFTKKKEKEKENAENKTQTGSLGQWARKDLTKEIKAAEAFKQKFTEESKQDPIKKDLRNLLNILTHDNYKEIKEEILKLIKDSVENQEKFLDVLFQKAVLEKAYAKLYSKLVKELDKDLPQKSKKEKETETDNNKKDGKKVIKKEHSEMRSRLIDKCKKIFQLDKNEQFDQYIKEKDPEERRIKLKKFMLGNVNFITELMKIKILSKKVGPDCIQNLYDRYQKGNQDKTLKELTIEAIIIFSENFGRIVYEEKKMKESDKQFFNKSLDDIFQKLQKIMDEPNLVGYIKYNIYNLLEKRKNNFALSKFDESLIAKTKEQVEKELENEGQITQENINEKIKKELKNYKDYSEKKNKDENEAWKISSKLLEKRINYGKTFGDILEGYFEAAAEIIETEKNPEYIRKYIEELIDYYIKDFSHKDVKELKERIIKLFINIVDISLDIPKIFDIYAFVLNIFLNNELIEFSDLSELQKEDIPIENISDTLKYLSNYYKKDDFNEKLEELSYVKNDKSKFGWAFN